MSSQTQKDRGKAEARKRMEDQEEVESPLETDIILGKTIHRTTHPGNAVYYETLKKFLPQYMETSSRSQKSRIVREIYNEVVAISARFLKKSGPGKYVVVDASTARNAIGHAIRYQETLSQQRQMQGKSEAAAASAAMDKSSGGIKKRKKKTKKEPPPVRGDNDRKPPAVEQRQNLTPVVPEGTISSAPHEQHQATSAGIADVDPHLVEFAFEFHLSDNEAEQANTDQKASSGKRESSDSSLFSTDELDAVLSVGSS